DDLFPSSLIAAFVSDGFEVDLANWNSSNYLDVNTHQYNIGSNLLGDPGGFGPGVTESVTTPSLPGIPSFTIPTSFGLVVNIGSPNEDAFVAAAVDRLKFFDSQDTIVLIGYSLGGNAVLSVARELEQQAPGVHIALLGLLDPVGYAPPS